MNFVDKYDRYKDKLRRFLNSPISLPNEIAPYSVNLQPL
jgi:hypothetical protein